jgi:PAS domain-containing protein
MGFDPASRIGVRRWDVAIDVEEEPEKWRLHIATLEAHQPFRAFRYRCQRADGSVAYIESNGKPVFDAEGRFLGYRGVSRDVDPGGHRPGAQRNRAPPRLAADAPVL